MGTLNHHKRNGKKGIQKEKIPQRRKWRADAVTRILGNKQKIKEILAKGRRRHGPFTRKQREERKTWLSLLTSQVHSWSGVGDFRRPIPHSVASTLTQAIKDDITAEYSGKFPDRELSITDSSFIITSSIRDT